MSGNTIFFGEKKYTAAYILAAVGSELTPYTKALAVAGMDQGTITLNDVRRYVTGADMHMLAAWRQDPAIQERLTRSPVVPLYKPKQVPPSHEETFIYRGVSFTRDKIAALLKGDRITAAHKAIVLLSIDQGMMSESHILRENRWLSALTLSTWRSDNEVRSAMEKEPQTVTLHDKEADALFRPCRRKTATG